jgi:hypothetical protein
MSPVDDVATKKRKLQALLAAGTAYAEVSTSAGNVEVPERPAAVAEQLEPECGSGGFFRDLLPSQDDRQQVKHASAFKSMREACKSMHVWHRALFSSVEWPRAPGLLPFAFQLCKNTALRTENLAQHICGHHLP